MNDNPIILDRDFDSDTSPVVRMIVYSSSKPSPFVYDLLGPKVISITNDSDSKNIFVHS